MILRHKLNTAAFTAVIGIFLASPLIASDFYKWTDEKGTVHYSQRAPENTQTETVHTYNTSNTGAKTTMSGTIPSAGGNKEEGEEKVAEPELAKKDPVLCERAKKDSETLRNRPLVRQNGKILTMDEKNEQIKKLQDVINVHC